MLAWISKILPLAENLIPTLGLLLLLVALVVTLWQSTSNPGRRLPPGPFSLPLIGHMFYLKDKPHLYYEGLRKKYGNIFGLFIGMRYTVIMSSPKVIKEMSMLEDFTGKPTEIFELSPDYQHIGGLNGEDWKEQRKFVLKIFRNLGMGKSEGETAVQVQIAGFLEQLRKAVKKNESRGVLISDYLFPAISNIIFTLICNRTFQENNRVNKLVKEFSLTSNAYFVASLNTYCLPWMKPLALLLNRGLKRKFHNAVKELEILVEEEVQRHEKNYTGVENLDYMDYYIEQLRQPTVHKSFNRANMIGNSEIFLLVGNDTIRLLLEWYLLYLAKNEAVQEKAHQELVNVVGSERSPQWEDRSKMPYLQAVLLEIERFQTLVPVNDPRVTLTDVKFGGYDIPKDTVVIMNFWSVHRDKKLWGDPENFRPERFLTDDQKGINNLEQHVTSFSLGRRSCPGEKLANVHLFLYLTAILQVFKIVEPRDGFQHSERLNLVTDLVNFRIGLLLRE